MKNINTQYDDDSNDRFIFKDKSMIDLVNI